MRNCACAEYMETGLGSSTHKTNYNFGRLYFYSVKLGNLLTKMNIAVRTFQVWSDDFSLKIKQEIKIRNTAESIVLVVY
jgi:hypothetical protein